MEWTAAQPVFVILMQPATEQILAWPLSAKATKGWRWRGEQLRGEQHLREAANDRPRWQSLAMGPRHQQRPFCKGPTATAVISMLTDKSRHLKSEYTEFVTSTLCVIKIHAGSSLVVWKWGWCLQGNWIRFAGKDQRCRWLITLASQMQSENYLNYLNFFKNWILIGSKQDAQWCCSRWKHNSSDHSWRSFSVQ